MSDSEKAPGANGESPLSRDPELERKLQLLNRTESRFRSWHLAEPGFEGIQIGRAHV